MPDLLPECNVGVRTGRVSGRDVRSWSWTSTGEGVLVGQGTSAGVADRHHLGTRYGGLARAALVLPAPATDERVGGRVKVRWVNDFDEGARRFWTST